MDSPERNTIKGQKASDLTDPEGDIHYATTHAEHLVNRAKYLGK